MAIHDLPGGDGRSAAGPAFPQRNAFVLQFAADSALRSGHFRGRCQHVASGQQVAFGSLDELREFIGQILHDADGTPVPAAGGG